MKTHIQRQADSDAARTARFEKILAPTDFSTCADQAFAYALDLAGRYGADLHVMHVIGLEGDAYSPLRYSPEAGALHESLDEVIHNRLRAFIDKHDTEGIAIRPVMRHAGAVAPTIVQYAETEDIDLIVMGTHGRHGLERMFMGSIAQRMLRHASCSVLTVRADETPRSVTIDRILVPVDFSEHTEALLRAAHALAADYEAQIDLLHVIEPIPFTGIYAGIMTPDDLVPGIKNQASDHLRRLWKQVGEPKVPVKLHVEEGHAATRILDFAERCGTDLIVMGAQGRSGAERFLLGSVVERVVRGAPCPVLIPKETRRGFGAGRAGGLAAESTPASELSGTT